MVALAVAGQPGGREWEAAHESKGGRLPFHVGQSLTEHKITTGGRDRQTGHCHFHTRRPFSSGPRSPKLGKSLCHCQVMASSHSQDPVMTSRLRMLCHHKGAPSSITTKIGDSLEDSWREHSRACQSWGLLSVVCPPTPLTTSQKQ